MKLYIRLAPRLWSRSLVYIDWAVCFQRCWPDWVFVVPSGGPTQPGVNLYFKGWCNCDIHTTVCVVDSPARSFECWTQLGGTYRCPCGLNCDLFSHLPQALLLSHRSLSDVPSKILFGSLWNSNDPTPCKTIKKYQLEQELDGRSINLCNTSYHIAHHSDLDAVLT